MAPRSAWSCSQGRTANSTSSRQSRGSGRRGRSCGTAIDTVGSVDAIVVPGGFAHGDYLRPGAIARFSPIMGAVTEFANNGGPVLGICNGFQVLTEAGLLPGALQKNAGLKFVCAPAELSVQTATTAITTRATVGQILTIPINHFEGNYSCTDETSGRATSRRSHRVDLCRQPQWIGGRHSWSLQ